ncbi:hypothetical protein [Ensifer canadensis]|uniref:hypothetical protein n=1 Tax=Ensifer canadensis TaxID=555315 RepID=UPI00148FD3F2|nr:hypothetical protein [Ensifer canadensis]
MKTAAALVHIFALGTCFVMQVAAPPTARMPGVRRAIQTIEDNGSTKTVKRATEERCTLANYSRLQSQQPGNAPIRSVNQCGYTLG